MYCIFASTRSKLNFFSEDYEMKSDKLVLLDVGSCFNPFQAYSDIFIPLAIDLCPADKVRKLVQYIM